MEKIHKNIRVFMLSCIKHVCFHVFSPFSAYIFPHYILVEKGLIVVPTFSPITNYIIVEKGLLDPFPLRCNGGTKWRKYMKTCMFYT